MTEYSHGSFTTVCYQLNTAAEEGRFQDKHVSVDFLVYEFEVEKENQLYRATFKMLTSEMFMEVKLL